MYKNNEKKKIDKKQNFLKMTKTKILLLKLKLHVK